MKINMWTSTNYEAWNDVRFIKLAALCKENVWYGIGAMNALWKFCQDTEQCQITKYEANHILSKRGLLDKILVSNLAVEVGENKVEIVGMRKTLERLSSSREKKSNSGRLGGMKAKHSLSTRLADAKQPLSTNQANININTNINKNTNRKPNTGKGEKEIPEIFTPPYAAASEGTLLADDEWPNDEHSPGTELTPVEVVDQKPKATPKPKPLSPHDIDLGNRWYRWSVEVMPSIKASPASFSEAIFATKRSLATQGRVDDLDGLLDALFAFVQKDAFWGKNALSPAGLLAKSKNGLRKVDNILVSMRGREFERKQKNVLADSDTSCFKKDDLDWYRD